MSALSCSPTGTPSSAQARLVWAIIAASLLLSMIPDIYGWSKSTPDHVFAGYARNLDDAYVYLSWTKQAADGHIFQKNLFTTEPQTGRQLNIYFLILGNTCRIFHLPLVAGSLAARLALAAALLMLIYRFYCWVLPGSPVGRLTAFALSALGAGLGWIFPVLGIQAKYWNSPVDTWQTEAFTFLSILTSGLFCLGAILILGTIFLLLRADERCSTRDALLAGLCALVLGNIHSYDVLHVAAAWALFLTARAIVERRIDWSAWKRAAIAGAVSLPSMAYQLYEFKTDPIFHARVEVPTLSPALWTYALGYGLTLAFALYAVVLLARSAMFRSEWRSANAALMIVCWVAAAFLLAYAPCSFQRKMIMGLHIPLCLLAGSAVAFAGRALAVRAKSFSANIVSILVVLLSLPTGLILIGGILHHIDRGDSDMQSASFLGSDDIRVFDWICRHTRPSDSFIGPPTKMLFLPAYCDRRVWCGHWGETPHYLDKLREGILFSRGQLSEPRKFLRETGAQYLIWPSVASSLLPTDVKSGLIAVYSNDTYTIYRILR